MRYDRNSDGVKVKCIPTVALAACTNSICFSLDGNWMYYADSPDKIIQCYRYDQENGTAVRCNDFVSFPKEKESVPDGSIIDSSGNLWNRY